MKKVIFVLSSFLALSPCVMAKSPSGHGNGILKVSVKGNITVKGKVTDEQGNPLPGASVYAKGTTTGTITDMDGNYTLTVPDDAVLEFSFIGYITQEYSVNGNTNIPTIKLAEDNKELEQVVVIGYGTQKKVDLTGSVAIVDADEMKKVSNSNISTMLQGKVAGVSVTTDGQPGADPSVRIRGLGTFGSTAPLYVVDGVPMGTTIRDFSPNDIATIQVLKDASAAAIYGSRAGNGVVIITTKQGKKNQKMRIDYSGYFGLDKIQDGVYDVMNSEEYGNYVRQIYSNYGNSVSLPSGYDKSSENYLDPSVYNTNWFDAMFKTGTRQNHNINLSGGSEHHTYNVGLDYFNQDGTLEGAGPNYERYTARLVNTMDVKFLTLKTNVVYSHSTQDGMGLSNANEYVQGLYGGQYPVMASALILPPTMLAYDESTWVLDEKYPTASNWNYDNYGYGTYYSDIHGDLRLTNPLMTNSLIQRKSRVDRIVATGTATIDIMDMIGRKNKNHSVKYNLNLSYSNTHVYDFYFCGAFLSSNVNYLPKASETLTEDYKRYSDALLENTLTYDGTFFNKNHVNVVVGQTFERERYQDLFGTGVNFPEPYYLQVSNGNSTTASSGETEHTLASYIGRLNYDYDSKYLLSATVRRDGSSRLEKSDRWAWFPSVSLGWRFDKENFFPIDRKYVNLFKVRGSYGELGNENIGEYQYMQTMTRGDYTYSFGGATVYGSSVSNFVNTAIAWEKKKTTDIGLDLGVLDGAIDFSFDWYKTKSEDLLYAVAVPAQTGVDNGTVTMNAASLENKGYEIAVSYHNYKHKVKYDVSANFSQNKNKVLSLGEYTTLRNDGDYQTEVGREVGEFFGYVYEGIYQTQEQIDNHAYQSGAQIGDCAYADVNGDNQITTEDRTYLGSGTPKFTYGLNGRVEWKNFDLSIACIGTGKFRISDYVYNILHSSYGMLNKSSDLVAAWTPTNTDTDVPRVSYATTNAVNNDVFSNRYIQNATYFKISNIELGYNFKDEWFNGVVSDVRFYVSAQNVYTFTKYKGYNVDFAGGTFQPGNNYCSYPTPRTIMFGLKCSF